jgi:hypothetical protein
MRRKASGKGLRTVSKYDLARNSMRYLQNTISGRNDEPGEGADMTFFNPKLSMLPMKGLAEREYASE